MKKTVKIIALALALVMVLGVLASCGVSRGTYVSESDSTYEFSGSRFTYTSGKVVFKGTYSVKTVDGDKVIILKRTKQYYDGKEIELGEKDDPYIGGKNGVSFVAGDGYIVIDETKYTKR